MTTKREPVDMSREAITVRLEIVRALYKLMASFRERHIDDVPLVQPRTRAR